MSEHRKNPLIRPFSATPNPKFLYRSQAMDHALRAVSRCIERAEGVACVIGSSGLGKSLLCHTLVGEFQDSLSVVLLNSARLCTRRALLQNLLFELHLPYRDREEGELRLGLTEFLRSSSECPDGLLLVIDEAQALPTRLLEELRMLTNFVLEGRPCVRLVLAGNHILEERLATADFESLNQRIVTRCYLEAMTLDETANFVREQLERAPLEYPDSFETEALRTIHGATGGVPRLINQLCDHVAYVAECDKHHTISSRLVEEAWADLQQLPAPWHLQHAPTDPQAATTSMIEFGELDDGQIAIKSESSLELDESTETGSSWTSAASGASYSEKAELNYVEPIDDPGKLSPSISSDLSEAADGEFPMLRVSPEENLEIDHASVPTSDGDADSSTSVEDIGFDRAEGASAIVPASDEPSPAEPLQVETPTASWSEDALTQQQCEAEVSCESSTDSPDAPVEMLEGGHQESPHAELPTSPSTESIADDDSIEELPSFIVTSGSLESSAPTAPGETLGLNLDAADYLGLDSTTVEASSEDLEQSSNESTHLDPNVTETLTEDSSEPSSIPNDSFAESNSKEGSEVANEQGDDPTQSLGNPFEETFEDEVLIEDAYRSTVNSQLSASSWTQPAGTDDANLFPGFQSLNNGTYESLPFAVDLSVARLTTSSPEGSSSEGNPAFDSVIVSEEIPEIVFETPTQRPEDVRSEPNAKGAEETPVDEVDTPIELSQISSQTQAIDQLGREQRLSDVDRTTDTTVGEAEPEAIAQNLKERFPAISVPTFEQSASVAEPANPVETPQRDVSTEGESGERTRSEKQEIDTASLTSGLMTESDDVLNSYSESIDLESESPTTPEVGAQNATDAFGATPPIEFSSPSIPDSVGENSILDLGIRSLDDPVNEANESAPTIEESIIESRTETRETEIESHQAFQDPAEGSTDVEPSQESGPIETRFEQELDGNGNAESERYSDRLPESVKHDTDPLEVAELSSESHDGPSNDSLPSDTIDSPVSEIEITMITDGGDHSSEFVFDFGDTPTETQAISDSPARSEEPDSPEAFEFSVNEGTISLGTPIDSIGETTRLREDGAAEGTFDSSEDESDGVASNAEHGFGLNQVAEIEEIDERLLKEIVSFRDAVGFDPSSDPVQPEFRPPESAAPGQAETTTPTTAFGGSIEANENANDDFNPAQQTPTQQDSAQQGRGLSEPTIPEIVLVEPPLPVKPETEASSPEGPGQDESTSSPTGRAHREDYDSLFDRLKG